MFYFFCIYIHNKYVFSVKWNIAQWIFESLRNRRLIVSKLLTLKVYQKKWHFVHKVKVTAIWHFCLYALSYSPKEKNTHMKSKLCILLSPSSIFWNHLSNLGTLLTQYIDKRTCFEVSFFVCWIPYFLMILYEIYSLIDVLYRVGGEKWSKVSRMQTLRTQYLVYLICYDLFMLQYFQNSIAISSKSSHSLL